MIEQLQGKYRSRLLLLGALISLGQSDRADSRNACNVPLQRSLEFGEKMRWRINNQLRTIRTRGTAQKFIQQSLTGQSCTWCWLHVSLLAMTRKK